MKHHARLCTGLLILATALVTGLTRAQGLGPSDLPDTTFKTILACLSEGMEIVMSPKPRCVERSTGDKIAKKLNMPHLERDWDEVCRDPTSPQRLPSDTIKRIAAQKEVQIAPSGIRILGAVFCRKSTANQQSQPALDLAGLDLKYSLVLDRSVVNGLVDARNLRIEGDLSIDRSIIVDAFRLTRARIDGSVYAEETFMKRLVVSDVQVNGSWRQTEALVLSAAHIHRGNFSGDLTLNGTAFSHLWIMSSQVAGILDIDDTEVRCAYHITSNNLGYLSANSAGFGVLKRIERADKTQIDYPWWHRTLTKKAFHKVFINPTVQKLVQKEVDQIQNAEHKVIAARGCKDILKESDLVFYVFHNTVRSVFCLTSFAWLAPENATLPDAKHIHSVLALNDTKINGMLVLDLWDDKSTSAYSRAKLQTEKYKELTEKHTFRAINLTTPALFHDFSDNDRPYLTHLDGVKFDRIYKSKSPVCQTDARQLELPAVDDVLNWLAKNASQSSQPFVAFASAFEQAGADATSMRVRRKTIDLCERTAQKFSIFKIDIRSACPGDPTVQQIAASKNLELARLHTPHLQKAEESLFSSTSEFFMLVYDWALYVLADHGLRPGKVVWSVAITIAVFAFWFWFVLGVIAFEPKREDDEQDKPDAKSKEGGPDVWPISNLFLFDRLIPAYRIRDEHYKIGRLFRRATSAEVSAGLRTGSGPPYAMPYQGTKLFVWPIDDIDVDRVEKCLVFLRIIGAILSIFLVAALGTLVTR